MATRRRKFRSKPKPQPKRPPANEEIRSAQVRLVNTDGSQAGVVSIEEARQRAQEASTDLVMVAEKAVPPVVRLMDLGKHLYEKRKKEAKQKVKGKSGEIKGLRIGLRTGDHDWQMRLNQAAQFLEQGNKVKVEMRLRGREKSRFDLAEKKMREFTSLIPQGARMEGGINRSPWGINLLLTR